MLIGKGAQIDTTIASGRMVFGIFATLAGLAAAGVRCRNDGRKIALAKAQVRLAQAIMAQRDASVYDLREELWIECVLGLT